MDGRALDLGGPRQRRVLSALLLDADRTVTLSRLIDVAWDDEPPTTARHQVQSAVAALRVQFGKATGHRLIVTASGGYVFTTDGVWFDAAEFNRAVAEGRALAGTGDLAGAAAALRAGQDLWRGRALADIASRRLESDIARLDEERLVALEECIDLELALGAHRRLTAELEALVADNPYRERLLGQYMLALYRCGRQADALTAFRSAARRLREELGLDPGPDLQALYTAIVSADPTLDHQPPADRSTAEQATATPAQLPAVPVYFCGRADQLRSLDSALDELGNRGLVVVSGPAGVGKTALVTHWTAGERDHFPDGQVYVNLHGHSWAPAVSPLDALGRILRAFGVPGHRVPSDVDEASTMYRSVLDGRRVLTVLDNAATADQVRPLIAAAPGCLTIVTSRNRLTGLIASDGARPIPLGTLTDREADDLLRRVVGDGRVDREPEATSELIRLCGHLPLALRIAAAHLLTVPLLSLAGYAERLRADRLGQLAADDDDTVAVQAAFDLSYATLSKDSQRMFCLLGLVPGPSVTLAAAAALADVDELTARHLMRRLTWAHMVEESAPDRFTVHDLLRVYARSQAGEPDSGDNRAALDRLYGWYAGGADAAADLVYPQSNRLRLPVRPDSAPVHGDAGAALRWLDDECANLVAAVTEAPPGRAATVRALASTLRGYFHLRMDVSDWRATAHAALADARAQHDNLGCAAAHLSLADLHWRQNQANAARRQYAAARLYSRRAGWWQGQESSLVNLAHLHLQTGGQPMAAARLLHAALQLNRDANRDANRADDDGVCLAGLALAHFLTGAIDDAVRLADQAVTALRDTGSRTGEGVALEVLGRAFHVAGHHDRAHGYLRDALAIAQSMHDPVAAAEAHTRIAALYTDTGHLTDAIQHAQRALALGVESGDGHGQAAVYHVLGNIRSRQGDHEQALLQHRNAFQLATALSDEYVKIEAGLGMARDYAATDQYDRARLEVARAFASAVRVGYVALEAEARELDAVFARTRPEAVFADGRPAARRT